MSKKIIVLLISIISFSGDVLAETTYDYSASEIFDPLIESASDTFNINIYFVIAILTVIVILLAIIFASTLVKKILFEPFREKNVLNSNISNRRIKNIDPTLDVNGFKEFVIEKFKIYTDAFSNFEYEKLKENLSEDLYDDKILELESLKKRCLKNIISNVKSIYCQINNVQKNNDSEKVDVIFTAQFKDYIVSISDSDVVMSGSKRDTQERTYLLSFEKKECHTACLKCGGEVQNDRCLFCRAEHTQKENNWILDKMKVLKQKTLGK